MTTAFDVIVVGGGAVGASALYSLTRQGVANVLLLEQKGSYGRGATGAWGSLVRIFHSSDRTSELAMESVPHLVDFDRETGYRSGFTRTGALYFLAAADRAAIRQKVERLNRGPLALEFLEAEEGRRRFPAFQWFTDDVAVYESHGGYADPLALTQSWIRAACDEGARAQTDTRVVELVLAGDRVTGVRTERGDILRCGQLVLATGAWSGGLVPDLPIEPRIIQVNEFFHTRKGLDIPLFIDLPHNTFGRPSPSGTLLAGCITDMANEHSRFVQHLSLAEANQAKRHISTRLSWIKSASLKGGIRAVEGYTDDGQGLLAYSTSYRNVLVAAGWSCTGFTLSPWIGRQIATMVAA